MPVWGADDGSETKLSAGQIQVLQREIQFYFTPDGTSGDLRRFESLRPWAPTLDFLLGGILARVKTHPNDTRITVRARRLLTFSAGLARTIELADDDPLRGPLEDKLGALLSEFSRPSHAQRALIEIFDRFRLWSPRQFWFFKRKSARTRDLAEHAHRIHFLIPRLEPGQLTELAQGLRGVRPQQSLQLSLLLETGRMTEAELTTFFRIVSEQFARALARRSGTDDENFLLMRLQSRTNRVISRTLNRVMKALRKGDQTVGSAFDKAAGKALEARPRDYDREDRLLFFALLQEGRLDWNDRASWKARADEISGQKISLRHRYHVDGNVLLVDFKVKRNCSDDLE
jgi:hypothetical protein